MSGGVGDGAESCPDAASLDIMKTTVTKIAKRSVQLGVVLMCMTCLTSCGVVTGLVGFLISLPIRVVDAICP